MDVGSLTLDDIAAALQARLDEIRRTLPEHLQGAESLQAHLMADHLRGLVRGREPYRCEAMPNGFRCY